MLTRARVPVKNRQSNQQPSCKTHIVSYVLHTTLPAVCRLHITTLTIYIIKTA